MLPEVRRRLRRRRGSGATGRMLSVSVTPDRADEASSLSVLVLLLVQELRLRVFDVVCNKNAATPEDADAEGLLSGPGMTVRKCNDDGGGGVAAVVFVVAVADEECSLVVVAVPMAKEDEEEGCGCWWWYVYHGGDEEEESILAACCWLPILLGSCACGKAASRWLLQFLFLKQNSSELP